MQRLKHFFFATRPKTLAAAIVPPMAAFFLARHGKDVSYLLLGFILLSAVMIQIATNLFNDVIDFEKGSDKIRVGPKRVSASGLVPPEMVKKWAYACLAIAFLAGIPLILRGGVIIFFLGVISLYLSYGYTGGIAQLAYRGLGELFVFLFFGLFAFLGSYYLFTLELTWESFYLACSLGLLATTLIGINNLRDRGLDILAKKFTLATRMKEGHYQLFCASTVILPYLFYAFAGGKFSFLSAVPIVFACLIIRIIFQAKGEKLNVGLKFASLHLLSFLILIFQLPAGAS
ncbi:MAG: 1,4-dihydroxy-2-naphthoate octaprenyltransferase [Bacteriovoracaceae bacterium]|nr:1,4-dihydroxy-2-naphthoate octaprenyltransferase [Bacteriovoracaceae bacterium]